MYKSAVYKGEELLGEVEIYLYPQQKGKEEENQNNYVRKKIVIDEILVSKEIRISHFSQPSERCPPLAVLHTITSGFCFKMESMNSVSPDTPLHLLHSSCIQENKTAVALVGGEELHLVAMHSRNEDRQYPCFWGFNVSPGLYDASLVMLNLRCLGIVFDLDETLVVANTMRSFEDRIEALQRKINTENDPLRIAGMVLEVQRYQDDKTILKQFVENDQIVVNGRVFKTQFEVVPALSDNHQAIVRPLIRLQERNIILTRINPQIRDTSVLVRLRPAWEDLRSYLTARGRKRFEVYVCTMAERDYALEIWRLLDPDSNLINSKELLDRIVCVKSDLKKSLFNVFQNGTCHPKMALVIDDRLKVWDEKDQSRVHVVPAFAPYYAHQAEDNNFVPVLCVARNVACSVRGSFFKDFDEGLLQKIPEVSYEDDITEIPSAPDVSSYLVSEDDDSTLAGNRDPVSFDGMADAEVEKRLKEEISTSSMFSQTTNLDPKLVSSYAMASSSSSVPVLTAQPSGIAFPSMQFPQATSVGKPLGQIGSPELSTQSSPAREEGEVPESELDPDTRRRLLILQHGQDTRVHAPGESPFPARPAAQVSVPHAQSHGNWVPVEEKMGPRQLNRAAPREFPLDSESMRIDKHRPYHPSCFPKAPFRDDRLRLNNTASNYRSFSDIPLGRSTSSNRELDFESGGTVPSGETPVEVLHDIAMKCGAKVEFKSSLVDSRALQFLTEVWFVGEKVGEGTGRTRREAQQLAADGSIVYLANIYVSRSKPDNGTVHGDPIRYSGTNVNGFLGSVNPYGSHPLPKDEPISSSAASESSRVLDPRLESSKKLVGSVTALEEFCMMEGLRVNFLSQSPLPSNSIQKDEVHAQVEIDGQVMGWGMGSSWDEAKMQAADKAIGSLRPIFGQFTTKRQGSPRRMQGTSNKRSKQEFPRLLQRMPSSAGYPKNAPPVP